MCGCLITYRPLFKSLKFSAPKYLSAWFSRRSRCDSAPSDKEDLTADSGPNREYRWSAARQVFGKDLDYQDLSEKAQVPREARVINLKASSSVAQTSWTTLCEGLEKNRSFVKGDDGKMGRKPGYQKPFVTVTRENSVVVDPWV